MLWVSKYLSSQLSSGFGRVFVGGSSGHAKIVPFCIKASAGNEQFEIAGISPFFSCWNTFDENSGKLHFPASWVLAYQTWFPYVIPTLQHPIGAGTYLSSSLSVSKKIQFPPPSNGVDFDSLRLEQEEARIDNLFLPVFFGLQTKISACKTLTQSHGYHTLGETSEVSHLSQS